MSKVELMPGRSPERISLVVDDEAVGFARFIKVSDTPIGSGMEVGAQPIVIGLSPDKINSNLLVWSLEFFAGANLLCASNEYIKPAIADLITANLIDQKELI